MTYDETYALVNAVGWALFGAFGWLLLKTAARAVGDWLVRWRLAGRPCNHRQEEKR